MSCPGKCRLCGKPRPPSRTMYCSKQCGSRASELGLIPAKPRSTLGPARPQHGMTEWELARYKTARAAALLLDGVPVEAICERLGMQPGYVYRIASKRGITCMPAVYPYGVPAR